MILLDKGRLLVDFDKDTRNFIDAAGLDNDVNLNVDGLYTAEQARMAVHLLVSGFKAVGAWDKCKAIYVFIGANHWQHALNLKDPRDLDEAHRITWVGEVDFNGIGAKSNSSLDFGITWVTPLDFPVDNVSLSVYSQDNILPTSESSLDMGVRGDGTIGQLLIGTYFGLANGYFAGVNDYDAGSVILTNSSNGYFIASRTSSVKKSMYQKGYNTKKNIGTVTRNSDLITILGCNNHLNTGLVPTDVTYSPRRLSFVHIGGGLTDIQLEQMNHIVNNFQAQLNRKV